MIVLCARCGDEVDEPQLVIEVDQVHDCPPDEAQLHLIVCAADS
jgi:hypothetical protein